VIDSLEYYLFYEENSSFNCRTAKRLLDD